MTDAWYERYRAYVRELEGTGVFPEKEPNLRAMREGLARLQLPLRPERTIVVAGTNGKGTTCAALEALLRAEGQRVGFYSSPHLVETTERFRLDGADLSPELFCRAFEAVRDAGRGLPLTHFEILTLMAAWLFYSGHATRPVDWAVFEVGLGGLWDATNAIPHDFAVIASLGIDHEKFLGRDLVSIARNKFGIVGPGARVVHARFPSPEVQALAASTAAQTQSRWSQAPAASWSPAAATSVNESLRRPARLRTAWGECEAPLPGQRGADNLSLAAATFEAIGYDAKLRLPALAAMRWSGRFEVLPLEGERLLVLSGDHNVAGLESLVEILDAYSLRTLRAVVGISQDKDADGILTRLTQSRAVTLHLTESPFKGRRLADYGPWLDRAASSNPDPATALWQAIDASAPGEVILVTGSLYLVGAVKHEFVYRSPIRDK